MASEQNVAAPTGLQVKASEERLIGRYSSHMQVLHTREEFVLDFMQLFPPLGQLVSRVVVAPEHFKRLVRALTENLAKYEKQFGKIQASATAADQAKEIGFRVE